MNFPKQERMISIIVAVKQDRKNNGQVRHSMISILSPSDIITVRTDEKCSVNCVASCGDCNYSDYEFSLTNNDDGTFTISSHCVQSDLLEVTRQTKKNLRNTIDARESEIDALKNDAIELTRRLVGSIGIEVGRDRKVDLTIVDELALNKHKIANHNKEIDELHKINLVEYTISTKKSSVTVGIGEQSPFIRHVNDSWNKREISFMVILRPNVKVQESSPVVTTTEKKTAHFELDE